MLTKLAFTKKIKMTVPLKNGTVKMMSQMVTGLPFVDEAPLVIGIDPGKYFGIALVGRGVCQIYSGVLDESPSFPLRECAFDLMQEMIPEWNPDVGIIEGASYNERYGQVKLAEIRCGFSLGLTTMGIPIHIVPPKKPRKLVFGNGDISAMNVWVSLNHNAADALCLALMPHYEGRRASDEIQGLVARRHK